MSKQLLLLGLLLLIASAIVHAAPSSTGVNNNPNGPNGNGGPPPPPQLPGTTPPPALPDNGRDVAPNGQTLDQIRDRARQSNANRPSNDRATLVTTNTDAIVINSKANKLNGDRFDFTFGRSSGRLEQVTRIFLIDGDGVEALRFRIRYAGLMEYEESVNGQPGFERGIDKECNWTPIRPSSFSFVKLGQTTINGTLVTRFRAVSSDNLFKFEGVVAGGDGKPSGVFVKDDVTVYPTGLKIDVTLNMTSYTYNSSCPNAKLALLTYTKSVSPPTPGMGRAEEAPKVNATTKLAFEADVTTNGVGAVNGFFTWSPTAVANGVNTVNVVPSSPTPPPTGSQDPEDANSSVNRDRLESAKMMTFSFDVVRPQVLVWDPETGYTPQDATLIPQDVTTYLQSLVNAAPSTASTSLAVIITMMTCLLAMLNLM